jgi:hypothetical protein
MIPDTVFNSRHLLVVLCFCVIAAPFLFSSTGNTAPIVQGTIFGYCMTDSNNTVVYFSDVYDTKLRRPSRVGTNAIAREFVEYLKGRYDFNAQGNFPSACPIRNSSADSESSKREFMERARQANKQIVETGWKFVSSEELIKASIENSEEDVFAVVARNRKPTHTYCLSDSAQGTLYTAGPVDTGTGVNLSYWYRGFDQLLRQKYSFNGQVYCNVGSPQEDERIMGARLAGARAAGKKIVNTGWKYDSAAVATTAPPQRDSDPEPAQRPAPPNPSRAASDNALKEQPDSKAYCQKDPAMSQVFICDNFSRVVYNYRMAHVNEAFEPLASLVAAHKLNCAECIDNTRVSLWVENRGAADKLSPKVTNCVSQNVIVTLYKTPEASQLREFYKQAVATCSKQ